MSIYHWIEASNAKVTARQTLTPVPWGNLTRPFQTTAMSFMCPTLPDKTLLSPDPWGPANRVCKLPHSLPRCRHPAYPQNAAAPRNSRFNTRQGCCNPAFERRDPPFYNVNGINVYSIWALFMAGVRGILPEALYSARLGRAFYGS